MIEMNFSINDKRWVMLPTVDAKPEESEQASGLQSGRSQAFENILRRKLGEHVSAEQFLNPKLEDLHDPYKLKGMKAAVDRIGQAMAQNESIWIYGDYDVDGITSVSLLLKCFKQLEYPVQFYIPDRHEEGYGLNLGAIDQIKAQGGAVLITVDCGISSVKEAEHAKAIGLDMIITDHHECQSVIPDALAVINPKQPDCGYPFDMLAGVGLAYKLATALLGELLPAVQSELCELAAFGTIADIAPLTDENRILAKFGLEALSQTKNKGFKALIDCSDLNHKKITAGHVGFMLAPKINAAGRIDDPKLGVVLLTTEDELEAGEIAQLLKETNDRRQQLEKDILEEAVKQLESQENFEKEHVTIAWGEGWNSGVIGIVASRLVEKYHKPALVFSIIEGKAKGSARSVDGFDVFEALSTLSHLYDKFGGHEQAAGLTVPLENFEIFVDQLRAHCQKELPRHLLTPGIKIDQQIQVSDVSYNFLDELAHLEPYGMGNPRPIFKLEGVQIQKKVLLGKNKEFTKFEIADGVRTFEAISFDKSGYYDLFKPGDTIDLVCHIDLNEFKGTQTIQFQIKDIRGYRESLAKNKVPLSHFKRAKAIQIMDLAILEAKKTQLVSEKFLPALKQVVCMKTPHREQLWRVDSLDGLIHYYNHLYDQGENAVFCPTSVYDANKPNQTILSVESHFSLSQEIVSDQQLAAWIPERAELIHFYKQLRSGAYEQTLPHQVDQWLCALILEAADLLRIEAENLVALTAPEEKIDLMEMPVYKALQNLKTTLKNR